MNPLTPSRMPTRILWACRHYWPHAAGRHARAAASISMTRRLADAGYHVEVVTPRYGTHWSESFDFHGIQVHRVASAPKGEWSMQRYVRFLGNWMTEQSVRFDAMVCDGVHEDARSIQTAIEQASISPTTSGQGRAGQGGHNEFGRPIGITICDGWGRDADEVWCRQARGGKRTLAAVAEMDHVVTRHAGADRFLIAHGVNVERIQRIKSGFTRPPTITAEQRALARKSLAMANSDLATTADDRVLLWCGHMQGHPRDNTGVATLVANARLMCGRYPNLRIWLIGDGEMHDWVHTELKAEGIRSVVAIPGSFSDMTDIWRAIDYVIITDEDQLRHLLPTAIGMGFPILLDEKPPIRAWINEHFAPAVADSFAWYDHHRAASLRKTFRMLWDDMPAAINHAQQVALEASAQFSNTEELRRWSTLLHPIPPDQERRA